MTIFLPIILFAAGTAMIIKGGDIFVDASGWMSDVTGISKVVIGATIVSLATTSPEYFVSLIATMKGYNDLAAGNAVGSLIANIGLAFALLAIFTPGRVGDRMFWAKGLLMFFSTAMLWAFCLNGVLSVAEGVVLLAFFIVSVWLNIRYSADEEKSGKRKQTNARDIAVNIAKFVIGAAAIVVGSNLIVDNGKRIAAFMGVSEAVIGLTVVALGTSLPELVTSISAIVKKQNALSIGNIIGANILDATLILSTGAFVSGGRLGVPPNTIWKDLPVTVVLMALAVFPTLIGKKLYRWQGIAIAAAYAAYLATIVIGI